MSSIIHDYRSQFDRSNNGLNQIILINVTIFIGLLLLKVGFTIAGHGEMFFTLQNKLSLSTSFRDLFFQPWSVVTHYFSDVSFLGILFDMLFLFYFGNIIHEFIGNKRLVSLYVVGGFFAGLFFLLCVNFIPYFAAKGMPLIGASGAVFAVVFGACTLLPDKVVQIFVIGYVRIKYIALFYLLVSVSSSLGNSGYLAQIGGAIFGFLFIKLLNEGYDLGKYLHRFFEFIASLFTEKQQEAPRRKTVFHETYVNQQKLNNSFGQKSEIPNDEEVDELLDKISKSGYESLSKEEKIRLFKASQKK